jgi:hypothetical protein
MGEEPKDSQMALHVQKTVEIPALVHRFDWVDARRIAGSHSWLGISIEFLLRGKDIHNRATRFLLHLYRSLPARVTFNLLFFFADQFRQCSLITVFAQKKSTRWAHD